MRRGRAHRIHSALHAVLCAALDSVLHAKASRTVCRMDGTTHQPAAWSDEFRAKHEALVK